MLSTDFLVQNLDGQSFQRNMTVKAYILCTIKPNAYKLQLSICLNYRPFKPALWSLHSLSIIQLVKKKTCFWWRVYDLISGYSDKLRHFYYLQKGRLSVCRTKWKPIFDSFGDLLHHYCPVDNTEYFTVVQKRV